MTELQFQPPTSSELSTYSKAFQGLGARMIQQSDQSPPSTATGMEMEPMAGSKRKEVAQETAPMLVTEAASKLQKKGPGRGKGKAKTNAGTSQSSQSQLTNLVHTIARLSIRHEDALAAQRLNQAYVMFLQIKSAGELQSLVSPLYTASQTFDTEKEMGKAKYPKRVILVSLVLRELLSRVDILMKNDDAMRSAVQAQLLVKDEDDDPCWPYLQWDPDSRQELRNQDREPMKLERWQRKMQSVIGLLTGETVLRCQPSRKLTANMEGDQVALFLEIGTVGEAEQDLHRHLRDMCDLSVWKMVLGRFRRDRLQRNPLANRVMELLPDNA
ncbi:unnamed protein product [Symbiodinium natans]|uniref:Uncharacterized protein n=1 Tax=Symbiodinium natans TaxID=878477 RepID=A0A812TJG4_9DINO|nr:unnamed protein product [Symbiodinium natans]